MKKVKTKSKLIEIDSEVDFLDADYEPIKQTKNTGAKVVAGFVSATIVIATLVGLKVVSEPPLDLIANQSATMVTEFKPIENTTKKDVLTTENGEKIVIDELTIGEILDKCNACSVNGEYYSKTTDKVVILVITNSQTTKIEPITTTIYKAPEGYVKIGTKCYKVPSEFDTSIGYENTENYTDSIIPSGYVLINNRVFEINKELFKMLNIDAVEVGMSEHLPDGYTEIKLHMVNKKIGIKTEDLELAIEPESKKIYSLPSGYILQDGVGIKTIQYKTEYILTEEEYQNKEYEQFLDEKGEYVSHTITIVEAKPMSDLYELLGIEYETPKKLTK